LRKKKKKKNLKKRNLILMEGDSSSGFEEYDLEKAVLHFLGEEEVEEKGSFGYFPLDQGHMVSDMAEKQEIMEKHFFEDFTKTEEENKGKLYLLGQQEKWDAPVFTKPILFQKENGIFEEETDIDSPKKEEKVEQVPEEWLQNIVSQQDFYIEAAGTEIFPIKAESHFSEKMGQQSIAEVKGLEKWLFKKGGTQKKVGWQEEKIMTQKENLKPMLDEIKEMLSDIATEKEGAFQGLGEEKIENPIFSVSYMMEEMKQRLWEERELRGRKGR